MILNQHKRTAHDERNTEAQQHDTHDVMELRRQCVKHRTAVGYEVITFICMDCDKQFKAYNWLEPDEFETKERANRNR